MESENKRQHLKMIQDVITRMATNFFLIKGWAITVFIALFGIGFSTKQIAVLVLGAFSVLLFWGMIHITYTPKDNSEGFMKR